jgi:RNA polymerase sigma factor (sigma-70 family)
MSDRPDEPRSCPTDRDDAAMAQLRAGEQDGLRTLVEDHASALLAALGRSFRDFLPIADLEDALQSAFVRAWRSPHGYDRADGTLRAWLFVIARNNALSLVRRRQRRQSDLSLDQIDGLLGQFAYSPADHERLRRVADLHACLRELPPVQRAVLEADLGGSCESTDSLRQRLRLTSRAIHNARHRGRIALAAMMRRLGHYHDAPSTRRHGDSSIVPEYG